jgi:predicted permease
MSVSTDLTYAVRLLKKAPIFATAAIGTLALGIGANTAIFSLVQAVLIRPLPYDRPDQVVMVWEDATAVGFPRNTPAPGNYNDWRRLNRSFTDMAATRGAGASLTMDGPPEQLVGRAVTANFFAVLGVPLVLGRPFVAGEDVQGAQVVVISHALWRRRYGADPAILGRTMLMSGSRYEIIGVAPRSFVFRDRDIDYWIPMRLPPQQANTRDSHFLNVVARLKPDVSIEMANADMQSIARLLSQQFPDTNRDTGAFVVSIRNDVLGDTRAVVIVLMAAAASILLIACANLASLLLSRAFARRGEFAVRLSLGATRGRLVRQLVVEGLTLSLVGGAIGLAIPYLVRALLERIVPAGLIASSETTYDWRLFLFACSASIVTGTIFSIAPALQVSRGNTSEVLQQHARGAVGGSTHVASNGLVILQVAATLVLLVAAGLMLRTLANLRAINLGFESSRLLTMRVVPPQPKYSETVKRLAFYDRIIAGVRALPGVERAAFASTLPFQSIGNTRGFRVEDRQSQPGEVLDALFRVGTPDYLQALGVKVREGRLIDDRDNADAPLALVINETMARRYWPGQSPVGQRIAFDEPWYTVVGVVRDVLERGYELEAKDGVYVAAAQARGASMPITLVVRVSGDPLSYAKAVQQVVGAVDPDQPVAFVRSMDDIVELTVADRQQQMMLLVAFGILALLIASLGLYGLLAQSVAVRSREIGLRIALGATWRKVIAMVMMRGIGLTAAGICLGAVAAWTVTRAMDTLLYGVGAADPVTFGLVIALLASVALAACAVPAVRAARVDPMVVLREQ